MDSAPVFVKGHGTENDFLVVVDDDGSLGALDPAVVVALCRRRGGIGADGVIRAVRVSDDAEALRLAGDGSAEWFMDYRNADGSLAEMCGNGIRVMAEVLARGGLVDPSGLQVATRSGVRALRRIDDYPGGGGSWAVGMGPVVVGVPDGAAGDAAPGDTDVDTLVAAPGLGDVPRPGLRVDVGNPHVVVAVTGRDELEAVDLGDPPVLNPQPADGANVEFVDVVGRDRESGAGHVVMRVHERGSGETRSCGTGAVAAAAAAAEWAGPGAPQDWVVDVRGGRLRVDLAADGTATLTGPVHLVATVDVERQWLNSVRDVARITANA